MDLKFFVPGVPVPKGSAKAFWHKTARKIVTMQDNAAKQKPWASLISLEAQARLGGSHQLITDACRIDLTFVFPRPKCHLGSKGLKPSAPVSHIKKPDLDKLIRCVLDALTGVYWADDSQVKTIHSHKCYVDSSELTKQPGVWIKVEEA